MSSLDKFYNSILNINNNDYGDKIKRIVLEERRDLSSRVKQLDGFCKYLANQIEYRIHQEIPGVHTYKIDLNDLIFIDHTILIVEYMVNSQMKRFLIDPSFIQFVKRENSQLIKLDGWPGDKVDKNILFDLVEYGLTEIDNISFQSYLDAFTKTGTKINLEDYLLDNRIGKRL